MDSPTKRMLIACVHCAKAKAKCDKKVPCSRCVSKQIICQSRATKRSSQSAMRRSSNSRAQIEHNSESSIVFHTSKTTQGSSRPQEARFVHLQGCHPHQHRHYMPDVSSSALTVEIVPGIEESELGVREPRTSTGNTPPDLSLPMTPLLPDTHHFENFLSMDAFSFNIDPEIDIFDMNNALDQKITQHGDSDVFIDYLGNAIDFQNLDDVMTINNKLHFRSSTQSLGSACDFLSIDQETDHDKDVQPVPYEAHMKPVQPISLEPFEDTDMLIMAQQSWPYFQCNQNDKKFWPPRTASIYLDGLTQTAQHQASWQLWSMASDIGIPSVLGEHTSWVEPLMDWACEKLAAITQSLFCQALGIHSYEQLLKEPRSSSGSDLGFFSILPTTGVIDRVLHNYVVRYEMYYPFVCGGKLDPNILMQTPNSKAAALLILLMLASGTASIETIEARRFTGGLMEVCRVCLIDIMERDVFQAKDVLTFRCSFLLTALAAWSGDKWYMEMAKGQRGMYLAMLQHAGIFDVSKSCIQITDCKMNPTKAWSDWKEHEGRHRLAHSWIIVDQEISLFSDTSPLLSVADLHTPIPDSEDLWQATSASHWLNRFEQVHKITYRSPQSIKDMFTRFVDGVSPEQSFSPIQLRLLLHPLQTQVCQVRDLIACLPDSPGCLVSVKPKSAIQARLEEITELLNRWYNLSRKTALKGEAICWITCANLIMYHLISLNVITSFKCIEQFARHEIDLHPAQYSAWLQSRCIDQPAKAFVHCGQILRLLRSMPKSIRPPWWAGAIYRVALTAWVASMATSVSGLNGSLVPNLGQHVIIDDVSPENETIARYAEYGEGSPMFTSLDGHTISASVPLNVLQHCIEFLDDDPSMRLTDGIKRKLCILIEMW